MKTLFVVYGYEDGNLGVFSTPKRAWEMAKAFLEAEPDFYYDEPINYSKFLQIVKERIFIRLTLSLEANSKEDYFKTVVIENFSLNFIPHKYLK